MAKKKVGRPTKPGGDGKSVRIREDIASKARMVAMKNNKALIDYLAEILEPAVERDYSKMMIEEYEKAKGKENKTMAMTREEIAAEKTREHAADVAADEAKDRAEEKQLRDSIDGKGGKRKGGTR